MTLKQFKKNKKAIITTVKNCTAGYVNVQKYNAF
jgi:hypothetical protein